MNDNPTMPAWEPSRDDYTEPTAQTPPLTGGDAGGTAPTPRGVGRVADAPSRVGRVADATPPGAGAGATRPTAGRMGGRTAGLQTGGGGAPQANKPKPPKNRQRRKRLLLIALLIFLALSGVLGIGGYFGLYAPARQLANEGATHLQNAQKLLKDVVTHPLDQQKLIKVRDEFSAAEDDFNGVNTRLNILTPFLGIIGFVTGRSDEITSYVHLAHMARDLSTAGHQALDSALFLIGKEQTAFAGPGSGGLHMGDISQVQQTATTVIGLVDDAWNEAKGVNLSALPSNPTIQAAVKLFQTAYPSVRETLSAVQGAIAASPQLLGIGHNTSYLVEIQDTSERRPTGGYITAYGTMSVQNGQFGAFSLQDTALLDTPYQASHKTSLPPNDAWFPLTKNWGLRDSNLEPDFPTAAKAAEQLYTAEGGSAVDGVIAFTPTFLTHVLTLTGPVQLSELNEIIDSTNLVDKLHVYQFPRGSGDEVSASALANDKHFPALLATHLAEKLHTLTPEATIAVLQAALLALPTKDIQAYVNDNRAEQALMRAHRAGNVEAAGDNLFIVDTNISANKANDNIDEVQSDAVILDSQGGATHHVNVAYHWKRNAPVYGPSIYTDYVRFYLPANSTLGIPTGFTLLGTSNAYGYTVVSGIFQLTPGQTLLLTLTYSVPNVAKTQQGQTFYSLLVQRQSGEPLTRLKLTITLPQSANLIQHSTNVKLSSANGNDLTFDQLIDRDETVTVQYA